MENASKALMMSAGVLIALLVVAVAARMFRSASRVTKSYDASMSQVQIATFNSNFTKFMGAVTDETNAEKQKYATIYDIISTATFAYDYNSSQVIDPRSNESLNDTGLVRVDLQSKSGSKLEHLQVREKIYDILLQECYYQDNNYPNAKSIITYEITVNNETTAGLIRHVTFTPMYDPNDVVTRAINKAKTALGIH